MSTVPGFLSKAYEIFNNTEYNDICGWTPNGESIIIKKIELFSKTIIPRYFKHANYQSFVRQLNMYDFHKTVQDPNNGEFHHPNFQRGKPELLLLMKRKVNSKQQTGSDAAAAVASTTSTASRRTNARGPKTTASEIALVPSLADIDEDPPLEFFDGDTLVPMIGGGKLDDALAMVKPEEFTSNLGQVMSELSQQQNMRDSIEKRLQRLEAQSARVHEENEMLKTLVLQSRQDQAKMQDKVTKVLVQILSLFSNSQAQLPPSLAKASGMLLADLEQLKRQNSMTLLLESGSSGSGELGYPLLLPAIDNASDSSSNIFRGISFSEGLTSGSVEELESIPAPKTALAGRALADVDRNALNSFDAAAQAISFEPVPSASTSRFIAGLPPSRSQLSKATTSSPPQPGVFGGGALTRQSSIVGPVDESGGDFFRSNSLELWGIKNRPSVDLEFAPSALIDDNAVGNFSTSSQKISGAKRARSSEGIGFDLPSKTAAGVPDQSTILASTAEALPSGAIIGTTTSDEPLLSLSQRQGLGTPLETAPTEEDIQPEEFLNLLAKKQEATLSRIDSLEYALGVLIEGDKLPGETTAGSGI